MRGNQKDNQKIEKTEKSILGRILEHLGRFCPKCGAVRTLDNLKITGRVGNSLIVHIQCNACGSQSLLNIIPNIGLSILEGLVTDVRENEFQNFAKARKVSRDDILDIYMLLRDTEDAQDLLSKLCPKHSAKAKEKILPPSLQPPTADAARPPDVNS